MDVQRNLIQASKLRTRIQKLDDATKPTFSCVGRLIVFGTHGGRLRSWSLWNRSSVSVE